MWCPIASSPRVISERSEVRAPQTGQRPSQRPARHPFYPHLAPVKLRCPEGNHRVMGWVYGDGTIELICADLAKGMDRRHLFNPRNGEAFTVTVEKPQPKSAPEIG
jgi:hypothetical protein